MRFPLLALLANGPAHGYELKQAMEQQFGLVLPPLNAGQIYTTLSRLERDGLVDDDPVAQNGRPNKRVYQLTEAGRIALDWARRVLDGYSEVTDDLANIAIACAEGAQQQVHP